MDLKTYRLRHGLTQSELAELLTAKGIPVAQTLISHWERTKVPAERAPFVADALPGVTLADLRPDLPWGNRTHGRRRDAA